MSGIQELRASASSRRPWRLPRSPPTPRNSSTSSPAAPAASITRSAWRCRKSTPRKSPARSRRCNRPRRRSRTSICCSRARARSPSRSAICWPTPGSGNAEVGFKAKLDKLRTVAAIYPNYIQIAALKDVRHQDARRSQGQAALGRRAEIRHRAQRPRHPRRRRHDLQGSRQGRISAVQRIGRTDEEPPARRHADLGRPRRVGDPRSVRLGRLRHRRDPEVGGGEGRHALSVGGDPGRHLQGPGQAT